MGGTGETKSSGSTLLPVVDYASKTKVALDENKTMKSQLEVLTKKVDGLMRTIEIYKSGGEPPASAKTEGGLAVVDYQAKAKALQAKVTLLTKQLKALKASKAKAATPVKKPAAPKVTNSNTQRPSAGNPTPRSTRTRSGNGSWRNSNNRTPTPKPSVR